MTNDKCLENGKKEVGFVDFANLLFAKPIQGYLHPRFVLRKNFGVLLAQAAKSANKSVSTRFLKQFWTRVKRGYICDFF